MRLLVISYYWPPAGGPGVQRWLKTSLALAELGHQVEILTVDPEQATYPLRDESLLDEAKPLTVHHTPARDWFAAYQKLTRRKEVPFSGFANQAGRPGPIQRLSRFIRGNFFLPDPRRGWNGYALSKARQLHAKWPFDVIITTGPPHSTHLIGRDLKRQLGIQWWADFRDPWTDIYYYDRFYPSRWARRLDARMEHSVLSESDRIITVSKDLQRLFEAKVPGASERCHIMPNGYDPADFSQEALTPNNAVYTLAYTGTLTLEYPVRLVEDTLRQILNSGRALRLRMAGRPAKEFEARMAHLQEEFPQFHTEFLGYLPHKSSVAVLQEADALLLLIPDLPNNQGILTGKLFEYLGSGRPIWGFGPLNGDAQEILHGCQAGTLFESATEASQCLMRWMDEGPTGASLEARNAYTRKGLASQLMA
ncbi:glycosyltransferase [Schleiferiaceae bacterium]|jgi:glycosyltransferase involved in cell wall biosynthesis|nr:glycosyltransferase [Schleiferiaceae bacterium]